MNKDILRLAIPSIISNITVPLLSLVDIAIMGHIGDATYLAAISIGAMIFNVMYWMMGFLRMGTSGLTSQALGRRDRTATEHLFAHGLQLAFLIGISFILLQWPLRELTLWLMQASTETRPLVSSYFNICILGAPAVLGSFAMNGWFIGMQNTVIPMRVAVSQNILNIILSLLFVFLCKMQIEGVALGTMLSQWLALAMLYNSAVKKYHVRLQLSSILSFKEILVSPLKGVGGALFLRTFCLVAVNFYFTSAGSQQGNLILAVNTLLMTFFTIFSYFMDGFAFAGEAMSGKFFGAGEISNLKKLHRSLLVWGAAMVIIFTTAYSIGGDLFLSLLTRDHTVVDASHPYFFWVLVVPVCGVMAFIYDGIFIGLTRSREMFHSCLLGAVAFFVIYLLPFGINNNHQLWIALNCYLLLRSLYLMLRFQDTGALVTK